MPGLWGGNDWKLRVHWLWHGSSHCYSFWWLEPSVCSRLFFIAMLKLERMSDMPGIIFISDKNRDDFLKNSKTIKEMTKITCHETFYRYVFVDVESMGLHASNVYMDHEDPNEKMYVSDDASLICMLSGEIFGKKELYSRLSNKQSAVSGKPARQDNGLPPRPSAPPRGTHPP